MGIKMIKRYNYEIILTFIFVIMLIIVFVFSGADAWGSETDWINQHFAIPEYFRTRFYSTGDIFPDFALQLGGGQNIYNLAYYGIFNPLYFPAYLMPGLRMSEYIQIVSILSVYISCILFYKFIKSRFNKRKAFLISLIFMFSAPLIYHSHRHIMFIQYMPFLIGSLIVCTDMDSLKNRIILAVFSCCIMLVSFYFSISVFLVIFIYMIYNSYEKHIRADFRMLKYIFLGVIISGFMWIPVLFTLLSGREAGTSSLNITELIFPHANADYMLYSPYSMGLTGTVIIFAVSGIFSDEKHRKILSWIFLIIMCFPLIVYLLNGKLYADSKILIPFIPLALILCGNRIRRKDIFKISAVMILFVISYILFSGDCKRILVLTVCDLIVSMIFLVRFRGCRRYIPAVIFGFVCCISVNLSDNFVTHTEIEEFYSDEIQELTERTIAGDYSFYRFANDNPKLVNFIYGNEYYTSTIYSSISNQDFRKFRFETSAGENQCRNNALQTQPYNEIFNILMGCRYRISEKYNPMYGETCADSTGKYNLFRNSMAFSVGYASSNIMSEDVFNSLDWNEKTEALLENIIADTDSKNTIYPNKIAEISCNFDKLCDTGKIRKVNQAYEVKSDMPFKICINPENMSENLIMLKFRADNRIGNKREDISVSVNGVKNKLSAPDWKYNNKNYDFTYILSSDKPVKSLMFEFSGGNYMLSDFEIYNLDVSAFESMQRDDFNIDRAFTKGDTIQGSINVIHDGWFNLSVPYDKGFKISVDGADTEYYKTNTAFIGFPINAGKHNIIIEYHAPFRTAGIVTSLTGTVIFLYSIICEINCYRVRKKFRRKCFI